MSKKHPIAIGITDTHRDKNNIKELDDIFNQLLALCKKLNVKRVFHFGDVFESRIEQPESVLRAVGKDFLKLSDNNIEIYCIPGNHCKTSYISESSFLDEFRFHPNFKLFSSTGMLQIGGFFYWFLPYFDENELYIKYLNKVKSAIEELSTKVDKSMKHILISHIAVRGAKSNRGEVIQNHLNSTLFEVFYKVHLGHFHDRSFIKPNIYYDGAPRQKEFSEDNEKGFTIFYEDGSHEYHQSVFKEYKTLEINLKHKNAFENVENAANTFFDRDPTEDYFFRLDITGKEEQIAKLDQHKLKKIGIDLKIRKIVEEKEIINIENLKLNKQEIKDEFNKWSEKEKPNNLKLGQRYLNKQLNG